MQSIANNYFCVVRGAAAKCEDESMRVRLAKDTPGRIARRKIIGTKNCRSLTYDWSATASELIDFGSLIIIIAWLCLLITGSLLEFYSQ